MKKINIRIGEHNFHIRSNSPKVINFFSINYTFLNKFQNNRTHMILEIESNFGKPFLNYEVNITSKSNTLTFSRADYSIEVDREFTYAKIKIYDELALKHALMNLYSCFIVHMNWGILLHSSCIVENNKAHIFSGHSGAGKSTAAKLSYPRTLLSDEASIIKITNNTVTVLDSPFRSEIDSEGKVVSYQLESIQLLNQSLTNNRFIVSKSTSFISLLDKVFYWTYDPEETQKILGLVTKLVKNVPVYELYFQKNNTFWELIS